MAKSKTLAATSAPSGRGGSYTTDPVTGIRTLVTPATAPSAPCCAPPVVVRPDPVVTPEPDANVGEHSDG